MCHKLHGTFRSASNDEIIQNNYSEIVAGNSASLEYQVTGLRPATDPSTIIVQPGKVAVLMNEFHTVQQQYLQAMPCQRGYLLSQLHLAVLGTIQ